MQFASLAILKNETFFYWFSYSARTSDAGLIITEDLQNDWKALTIEECNHIEVTKLIIAKMATLHGIMYKWLELQDEAKVAKLVKNLKYPIHKENALKIHWKYLK